MNSQRPLFDAQVENVDDDMARELAFYNQVQWMPDRWADHFG